MKRLQTKIAVLKIIRKSFKIWLIPVIRILVKDFEIKDYIVKYWNANVHRYNSLYEKVCFKYKDKSQKSSIF